MQLEHHVVSMVSERLAARISDHRVVLLQAPPEYFPWEIARAVYARLHGAGGFRELRIAEDREEFVASAVAGVPILARVTSPDQAGFDMLTDLFHETVDPSRIPHVLTVFEADEPHGLGWRYFHDLMLDHRDLLVTSDEVTVLHPESLDGHGLVRRVQQVTGGVPRLVAVGGVTAWRYEDEVEEAAMGWARRLAPLFVEDDLLSLLPWAGRISEEGLAALAGEVLGRRVSSFEVQRILGGSWVSAPQEQRLGQPSALASALRRVMFERDADAAVETQAKVSLAARRSEHMRGLDRMAVLLAIEDWEGIDRLLASKLYLLMALRGSQREMYGHLSSASIPPRLERIRHARRFLQAHGEPGDPAAEAQSPWRDVAFLLLGMDAAPAGSVTAAVQAKLATLSDESSLGLVEGRRAITDITRWLGDLANQVEPRRGGGSADDDAALVQILLLATADAAILVGGMAEAQDCVRRALRLGARLQRDPLDYPTLLGASLARAAFLAAMGGQPSLAQRRLDGYQEVITRAGRSSPMSERMAALARRYPGTDGWALATPAARSVDPELPLAAFAAEAEGMRALLLHGVEAGTEWLRGMLNKVVWSSRPSWEWWPLYALMALVDAREGRPEAARHWLAEADQPPALDLVIRAAIEYASGRPQRAKALADRVLVVPDVPTYWRHLALGLTLASITGTDPHAVSQRETILGSEDWASLPASVVLFPAAARALVIEGMAPDAVLPGLAAETGGVAPVQTTPDVRLTSRQAEILRALATSKTMAEIAETLYVSPETIRSTSKMLY